MSYPGGLVETRFAPDRVLADPPVLPLATWRTTHPWWWAAGIGIGGTVLTAFGVGFSQVRELDLLASTYAQAGFVALSALLGLLVMWRSRPALTEYGWGRPRNLRRVLWALPLAVLPLIVVGFSGVNVGPGQAVAYVALAFAVGFNEEIWFRGLLLAALRRLGTRKAVLGGAAVFGALHLANLFAGRSPLYLGLQFVLACLVGLVLAELVTITGSLWIGIVWHIGYDLAALSAGDELTPAVLSALAVMVAVLAAYAAWLWRTLPRRDREAAWSPSSWS